MVKTTVKALLRSALKDPLFAAEYYSRNARIRRALLEAFFRLRKRARLTQEALAERAGSSRPYIAKIERGDAPIVTALEELETFANAAGASVVISFIDSTNAKVLAKVPLGGSRGQDGLVKRTQSGRE